MDREMASLWLKAERRIDLALAGIVACALWFVVLPLIVLLTDATWNSHLSLALVAALPVGLVFVRPLQSGLVVARAIEARDGEEIDRWRDTGIPPAEPDLLRGRMRRVHHPALAVLAAASASIVVLAAARRSNPHYPAMAQYSTGIAMVAGGIALGAVILMFEGKVRVRVLQTGLALTGWLIPVGFGIGSAALILGRQDIARAMAVRAMTAMAYVIFGLIGLIVTVVLAALWVALATIAVNGSRIDVGMRSRAVPELPVGRQDAPRADPEFDETDVDIVREALAVGPGDYWLGGGIAIATAIIVGLPFADLTGTPVHVAAGAVLVCALGVHLRRLSPR